MKIFQTQDGIDIIREAYTNEEVFNTFNMMGEVYFLRRAFSYERMRAKEVEYCEADCTTCRVEDCMYKHNDIHQHIHKAILKISAL